MTTHTVTVEYTDRTRNEFGRFNIFITDVTVEADSTQQARLTAAQLVTAIRTDRDIMVTDTY